MVWPVQLQGFGELHAKAMFNGHRADNDDALGVVHLLGGIIIMLSSPVQPQVPSNENLVLV